MPESPASLNRPGVQGISHSAFMAVSDCQGDEVPANPLVKPLQAGRKVDDDCKSDSRMSTSASTSNAIRRYSDEAVHIVAKSPSPTNPLLMNSERKLLRHRHSSLMVLDVEGNSKEDPEASEEARMESSKPHAVDTLASPEVNTTEDSHIVGLGIPHVAESMSEGASSYPSSEAEDFRTRLVRFLDNRWTSSFIMLAICLSCACLALVTYETEQV